MASVSIDIPVLVRIRRVDEERVTSYQFHPACPLIHATLQAVLQTIISAYNLKNSATIRLESTVVGGQSITASTAARTGNRIVVEGEENMNIMQELAALKSRVDQLEWENEKTKFFRSNLNLRILLGSYHRMCEDQWPDRKELLETSPDLSTESNDFFKSLYGSTGTTELKRSSHSTSLSAVARQIQDITSPDEKAAYAEVFQLLTGKCYENCYNDQTVITDWKD